MGIERVHLRGLESRYTLCDCAMPTDIFGLTEPPGLSVPHLRHAPLSGASRHTRYKEVTSARQ